jgi:ABC-2 type transport system ATP-binding protein
MKLFVKDVSKSYGDTLALDNVSLCFMPGVYALLGPNGAGKSTLMNLIVGNLYPDKGHIMFNGKDIRELGRGFRSKIGFMPQQQKLFDSFTGFHFLSYMASLKGLNKETAGKGIREVLELVNLTDDKNKKLGAYSGGMKQRILIAQALLGHPDILILDEPTAGLDPRERIRVRNLISEIAAKRIVIIATHVVSDIEEISKEIILIKKGRILQKAEPRILLNQLRGKVFDIEIPEDRLNEIKKDYLISRIYYHADHLSVRVISDNKPEDNYAREGEPTLDEVYLYFFRDEVI